MQKNLAHSLQLIAQQGPDAFYKGKIADEIAAEMAQHGGLIGKADLAAYRAVERKPVSGSYRGYEVFSMPPPSSGGIHIVQILNIWKTSTGEMGLRQRGRDAGYGRSGKICLRRPLRVSRRSRLRLPQQALTSKAYAKTLAQQIDVNKARPSADIKPGKLAPYESNQTTHFSVVDKDGNAVAVTYTLNTYFGSGVVAGNSGILMNNEMDDFSAKPGTPNVYGLVGGEANAIQPAKRPLSSMSPTIVAKDGKTAGDRQPGRQSDYHHGAANGGEQYRFRHERGGSHQCAALPPSVAAGSAARREGLQPGYAASAGSKRSACQSAAGDGQHAEHHDWPGRHALRRIRPALGG